MFLSGVISIPYTTAQKKIVLYGSVVGGIRNQCRESAA